MKKDLNRNWRNKHSGFSLAEILISLVIFSVGSVGVGKLYGSMINGSVDSKNRFEAATLAEARLETLRFAHKVGDTAALTSLNVPRVIPSTGNSNTIFTEQWTVTDLGQGQATIVSTISWQDQDGNYPDANSITLSAVSSDIKASLISIATPPVVIPPAATPDCSTLRVTSTGSADTYSGAYGSGTSGSGMHQQDVTGCGSGTSYSYSPSWSGGS